MGKNCLSHEKYVNLSISKVIVRDRERLRLCSDPIRFVAHTERYIGKRFSDQILFFDTDIDVSVFVSNFCMF
jgi:hypothetical protein